MSNKLKHFLINTALIFMIAELSYINSKSLLHLSGSIDIIHQTFAIIGAIAFSLVTIIVMQQSNLKWQKVIFPLFDAALVFGGFNLDFHPEMRSYLTIFMALFAGMIMYSLGQIEYHQGQSKESKELEERNDLLNKARKQIEELQSVDKGRQLEFDHLQVSLTSLQKKFEKQESDLHNYQSKLKEIEPKYIKSELGRIHKKNKENLSQKEKDFLKNHETLKK